MHLTHEPIRLEKFFPEEGEGGRVEEVGAEVLFLGRVRRRSNGKAVLYLSYEAFEEMAERVLAGLTAEALRRWPLEALKVLHRLGRVEVGEIAVAIEVKSVHREEAYVASRFLIEAVKHRVPIWKKEYFEDGTSEWGGCHPYAELQAGA